MLTTVVTPTPWQHFGGARGLPQFFPGCDCTSPASENFTASVQVNSVGVVDFHNISATAFTAIRAKPRIAADPIDSLLAVLVADGILAVSQGDRTVSLIRGQIGFLRGGEEFSVSASQSARMVVAFVPFALIPADAARVSLMTSRILVNTALTKALAAMIAHLGAGLAYESGEVRTFALNAFVEMLRATIHSVTKPVEARDQLEQDVRRQIRDHIEQNLSNPRLGPASIARALAVSVRYVHRLQESEQHTLATNIRNRRVLKIGHGLTNTLTPFSKLVHQSGFRSLETARRAFSRYFGETPQRYRDNAHRHTD